VFQSGNVGAIAGSSISVGGNTRGVFTIYSVSDYNYLYFPTADCSGDTALAPFNPSLFHFGEAVLEAGHWGDPNITVTVGVFRIEPVYTTMQILSRRSLNDAGCVPYAIGSFGWKATRSRTVTFQNALLFGGA
jgi:hypothetical protein